MQTLISDLFQSESVQCAVASSVQQVRLRFVLLEHQDRGVKLPNAFSLATTAVVARFVNPGRRLSSLCSCHDIVQVSEAMAIYCRGNTFGLSGVSTLMSLQDANLLSMGTAL